MPPILSRNILNDLISWSSRKNRKPLILRGARQVGKSTLVRMLADKLNLTLITLNFERFPKYAQLFTNNDPKNITQLISLEMGVAIDTQDSLLFLDEIQVAPEILARLRYFYEEMPDLRVICAGSLLEFELEEPSFSMPVGRIEYMHIGPMTFEEFLKANNEPLLVDFLKNYQLGDDYPMIIHEKFMQLLKIYTIVGGMPEAVQNYVNHGDFMAVERVKNTILTTYQDDFSKYAKDNEEIRLREVFERISRYVARKVQYSKINPDIRSTFVAKALKKLALARVIYLVQHSACNGVPLGAEINEKIFKTLFLDVGLLSTKLQLSFLDLNNIEELTLVNQGVVIEQLIGQHLLYDHLSYEMPYLYYWQREKVSSQAEVDYVISVGQQIIPIEVKAGKAGTLRSLHVFLQEKKLPLAIRFYSQKPEQTQQQSSQILSLPLYMIGQVGRLSKKQINHSEI